MISKSLPLLNQIVKRPNISSTVSCRLATVQKIKRVKVNSFNGIAYVNRQITRVSSITIESVEKNHDSFRSLCWLYVVIVEFFFIIEEGGFIRERDVMDDRGLVRELRGFYNFLQKFRSLCMRNGFKHFSVFFKRGVIHLEIII